ncbi:hypothetical protein jaqu_35950 [Jannaschia aquimarina]|uniref:Uncharacterized protein n=1 Tax=Jannaschia aquimarina TaxID=935700 RepID=A0A0D1D3F5_9RHOB|nr:hypothetical protein [Jannaschia aquimarina]KIT14653.1 hypothetical protein jaqu_35950 [Jannaschia aquimarina]
MSDEIEDDDTTENEIVVVGTVDDDGGGGGTRPPPDDEPDDPDEDDTPEIVVTARRPSEGQEDFADDNNPFNDGEAPTADTVLAWLEWLSELGAVDSFFLVERDPDDPSAGYTGEYVTDDGDQYAFESDGEDNYGQYQEPSPPPPPPQGPQLGYLDEFDWIQSDDPNVHLF